MNEPTLSWNRIPKVKHSGIIKCFERNLSVPKTDGFLLPHGNGRSYGDVCLNNNGFLLMTRTLNRFIAFDRQTGRLQCEAGVLLKDILDLVVPQGWFLPVTPGTQLVTVGGAIANDIHGKNHHIAGSFGNHVLRLELVRSDGQRIECGPDLNHEWFSATVGGLGLTGLITWVEIQLETISNPFMLVETFRFNDLDSFWAINSETESRWPYTVSWIDCLSGGKKNTRGLFLIGKHAPPQAILPNATQKTLTVPIDSPISLINGLSLRIFNELYYRRPLKRGVHLNHYISYFYPLDSIARWNRIYGKKGFFQYQCVLPPENMKEGIAELLEQIRLSKQGSFLAVLKTFGKRPSVGMLSFPRPGATLALDFPNHGAATLKLFERFDSIVSAAGGALYPAKDTRMPSWMFKQGFPGWEKFNQYIDPNFSSGFWRRVNS